MYCAHPEAHKEYCRMRKGLHRAGTRIWPSAQKGAPKFEYKFNPFPYSFPTRKGGQGFCPGRLFLVERDEQLAISN